MLSIQQLLIFTMLVDKVTSVVRQSLLRKRKRNLRLHQIAHNRLLKNFSHCAFLLVETSA